MRLTKQRRMILAELAGMDTHPTAEEMLAVMRRRLPSISIGSVYRNLEALADAGMILRLDGRARRYDGRAQSHVHVCCPECGGVRDWWEPDMHRVLQRGLRVAAKWGFTSCRMELQGRCGSCAGAATNVATQSQPEGT